MFSPLRRLCCRTCCTLGCCCVPSRSIRQGSCTRVPSEPFTPSTEWSLTPALPPFFSRRRCGHCARTPARRTVCLPVYHARMQQPMRLLHRALHPRPRAQPPAGVNRAGGAPALYITAVADGYVALPKPAACALRMLAAHAACRLLHRTLHAMPPPLLAVRCTARCPCTLAG